jgi:hypothetical protein
MYVIKLIKWNYGVFIKFNLLTRGLVLNLCKIDSIVFIIFFFHSITSFILYHLRNKVWEQFFIVVKMFDLVWNCVKLGLWSRPDKAHLTQIFYSHHFDILFNFFHSTWSWLSFRTLEETFPIFEETTFTTLNRQEEVTLVHIQCHSLFSNKFNQSGWWRNI